MGYIRLAFDFDLNFVFVSPGGGSSYIHDMQLIEILNYKG